MRDRQQRRSLVDYRVQGALCLQVLKHWLLFVVATFVLLLCLEMLLGDEPRTLASILGHVWQRCGLFYVVMLAMLPAFLYDVLRLSRRFVGPVYRIRGELRRLGNGETVAPVRLRNHDFWHDLAEAFNACLARTSRPEDECERNALASDSADAVAEELVRSQAPL